jgi:4-alpha-glucanotransferase
MVARMGSEELRRRARAVGVATSFQDAGGRRHRVPDATLEAVLAAMPAAAAEPGDPWPPVVVLRAGAPRRGRRWAPPKGERVRLLLESGEERRMPASLPGDLPLGYHRVEGERGSTLLVVAPPGCHLPAWLARGGRAWGFVAHLYALTSRASWGIGDLGDLAQLAGPQVAEALGAAFVLLNPLHAAEASQPSPYFPSSRLFRNPLYVRVEAVPELARLDPEGRARVAELAAAGRRLSQRARIDREAVERLKDEALRRCHQALDADPARLEALAAYRAGTPGLDQFAAFCGLQGELGRDWRDWPAAYRDPDGAAVRRWAAGHPGEVRYHAWLQWLLDQQLAAVPRLAVGLLGDLAVGVDPGGFDAWTFQRELAPGVTVGAPPDPLGPHGQDWGFPPFVPARLAATGYEPFARTLRAGFARAQGLRIDHVMGMFRLFWIPRGRPATEGTYVRYPADDLLGVLALESRRAGALVIGEDLGTVAAGVRERLAVERVLSYRLAWFERAPDGVGPRRAADYPRLALAAATTHDLPTVAGFFSGADLAHLRDIGVVAEADLPAAEAAQEAEREQLRALLAAEGLLPAGRSTRRGNPPDPPTPGRPAGGSGGLKSEAPTLAEGGQLEPSGRPPVNQGARPGQEDVAELVVALHTFLARTPSMLVAATLEDAVGSTERLNVPGTIDQHPNWSVRLPVSVEDLPTDPRVRRLAAALSAERPTDQPHVDP